jgi:hypothetical protein
MIPKISCPICLFDFFIIIYLMGQLAWQRISLQLVLEMFDSSL